MDRSWSAVSAARAYVNGGVEHTQADGEESFFSILTHPKGVCFYMVN